MASRGAQRPQPARAVHRHRTQAARRAAHARKPRRRAGPLEGARAPARGRGVPEDAQEPRRAVPRSPAFPGVRRRVIAVCAALAWAGAACAWVDETELDGLDVVFLGEVHDNPIHHALQADAVRALRPAALVFEMLTPAQAALINDYVTLPDANRLAEALSWDESGWPDFAFYAPILAAGVASGARVYGTTLPRDRLMQAMRGDPAGAFGQDAGRYGL